MKLKFSFMMFAVVLGLSGCSEKNSLLESLFTNNPPRLMDFQLPLNNSIGQSTNQTLSWRCNDPEGDGLIYDVYFGTDQTQMTKVSSGLTTNYLNKEDLSNNTTYYWRIIASDSKNATTEGPVWQFKTKLNNYPPSVPFNPSPESDITNPQPTTVILSWSCSDPESDTLTYDVYFGESTYLSKRTTNQTTQYYTPFTISTNKTYYWKIVARDSKNATTEGPVWRFKTSEKDTGYDFNYFGHVYKTVVIGSQVWTVDNLQTAYYNDGFIIEKNTDNLSWANAITSYYCNYNNNESFVSTYGFLYNWYAVNSGKLAPPGWRVPSDADWDKLIIALGENSMAGTKLKAKTEWLNNGNGTDEYGFKAFPGGNRSSANGTFENLGYAGYWWSSTPADTKSAWYREIYCADSFVKKYNGNKRLGLSVRLVRDILE